MTPRMERQTMGKFLAVCVTMISIVVVVVAVWNVGRIHNQELENSSRALAEQTHPLEPQDKAANLATEFDLELSEIHQLVLTDSCKSAIRLEEILSDANHAQMIDCVFFLTGLVDEENYSKVRRPIEIAMTRCEEAAQESKDLDDRIALFEIIDHASSVMNDLERQPLVRVDTCAPPAQSSNSWTWLLNLSTISIDW